MRFTDVLVVLVFLSSVFCCVGRGFSEIYKINEAACEYKKKNDADYFIFQSFRNTCNGKGFKSLNEWQITCRAMWNLEYIAWADAGDFMEVNYSVSDKKLMYGKWNGKYAEGEVYSRSLSVNEN